MKKFITAIFCTALAFSSGLTAYAAENLDRDYIEAEIWEDMWNGKGDNGIDFPEASYKHHLLDKWLDENYGSEDYDWTELGELKYEYKDYYRSYIEDFDFNDDDNGNWTIETPEHSYSFTYWQDKWIMTDENGDTVDSFPPFSTLEEDEEVGVPSGNHIDDNGNGSPRVVGKVDGTGRTETASEGLADGEGNDTTDSGAEPSEGDSERSGIGSLAIIAGVIAVAGIGGIGYYFMKKKR